MLECRGRFVGDQAALRLEGGHFVTVPPLARKASTSESRCDRLPPSASSSPTTTSAPSAIFFAMALGSEFDDRRRGLGGGYFKIINHRRGDDRLFGLGDGGPLDDLGLLDDRIGRRLGLGLFDDPGLLDLEPAVDVVSRYHQEGVRDFNRHDIERRLDAGELVGRRPRMLGLDLGLHGLDRGDGELEIIEAHGAD